MSTPPWDILWTQVHLATMAPGEDGLGLIRDGALAVQGGRIAWVGPARDLPAGACARETRTGGGAWLLPGLIDCHTHLVFAGDRAQEFEWRLEGLSYQDIARKGGGILATVKQTRAAAQDALVAQALPRLEALRREGVTTVEIKSGYGLETETELKMLRAARELETVSGVRVVKTFLGAHALPPDHAGRRAAYVDLVCEEMLPAAVGEGLVEAVDGFCETIAFTPDEIRRVFEAAKRFGLPVKLHAEQLSAMGGAALAAAFGALSADHLEYADEDAVRAMAASGTVAVLLPGAFYFLRGKKMPPVDMLRRAGVPMAIASDCNPGSSPFASLLLMANMACTLFGLTPTEVLLGITCHAARALGLEDEVGSLEVGKKADMTLWRIDHPRQLCYWGCGLSPDWVSGA